MRYTIQTLREARGWSQARLAAETGISPRQISRHESRDRGPTTTQREAYARVFQCSPYELDVEPRRPDGRPRLNHGDTLLPPFRAPKLYDPTYGRPSITKLPSAREYYPALMAELEQQQVVNYSEGFLREAPSGSSLETVHQLLQLRRDAHPTNIAPVEVGLDHLPVVERDSNRVVGHCPVPALVTKRWLMIFQVTLLTVRGRRSMDALLVVRPRLTLYNLEIDGRGHDFRGDPGRQQDLGLPALRLTEADVLEDLSWDDRLRGL